jgi:hypothetical protein
MFPSPELDKAVALVSSYLDDEMTYDTLWKLYNAFFMHECEGLDEATFQVLDAIWADLEVTTSSKELWDEYPGHHLDEEELRVSLRRRLKDLSRYSDNNLW